MRHWHRFEPVAAMASRWRRRPVCALIDGDGRQWQVALRMIDGRGAQLEGGPPPALGTSVELVHPEAGAIGATVSEIGTGCFRIRFDDSERAVAYALAAIAADMTRRR